MNKLARAVSSFLLLLVVISSSGCANAPKVATRPYTTGRVLLLPPRDVVQNGVPHEKGVGSGQEFQNYLRAQLQAAGYEVVTTDSAAFSATEIASKEQGLAEAKRLKVNYVFQSVLGEFQDAAPMTFRPDYAYLDKAVMYDVRNGEPVWELTAPQFFQKGNIGSYHELLDEQAKAIAASIKANQQ